jgi:hypothetical protein
VSTPEQPRSAQEQQQEQLHRELDELRDAVSGGELGVDELQVRLEGIIDRYLPGADTGEMRGARKRLYRSYAEVPDAGERRDLLDAFLGSR